MKKLLLVIAVLAAIGVATYASALVYDTYTVTVGGSTKIAKSTKAFDLSASQGNTKVSFQTYSSTGIVKACVGQATGYTNLTTVATTAKTTTTYTVSTPYRFVYVRYTSVGGSGHNCTTDVYGW